MAERALIIIVYKYNERVSIVTFKVILLFKLIYKSRQF